LGGCYPSSCGNDTLIRDTLTSATCHVCCCNRCRTWGISTLAVSQLQIGKQAKTQFSVWRNCKSVRGYLKRYICVVSTVSQSNITKLRNSTRNKSSTTINLKCIDNHTGRGWSANVFDESINISARHEGCGQLCVCRITVQEHLVSDRGIDGNTGAELGSRIYTV